MARVFRNDVIKLRRDASEEDFEKFMMEELVPYFGERYRGPTRASIADLESQSLAKDIEGRREYLWTMVWIGPPESVRGSSFEHTRIGGALEDTEAMLKKLESFGQRAPERVFSEVVGAEEATA